MVGGVVKKLKRTELSAEEETTPGLRGPEEYRGQGLYAQIKSALLNGVNPFSIRTTPAVTDPDTRPMVYTDRDPDCRWTG